MTMPASTATPDPSELTTDAILREVAHLRDLHDLRFDQLDLRLRQRYEAQSKALDAALLVANQTTASLAGKIDTLARYAATTTGTSIGGGTIWGYVVGAVFLISAVVTFVTR